MKKIFLPIILLSNSFLAADCATPSEYVMHFLKNSTTLVQGSKNWRNDIRKNGGHADTIFARTHNHVYEGFGARAYAWSHANLLPRGWHLMEDAASGNFKIENNNGTIEITSNLCETQVIRAESEKEAQKFRNQANQHDGEKIEQQDLSTKCIFETKLVFNEDTQRLETTLISACQSKMPLATFLAAVNALK